MTKNGDEEGRADQSVHRVVHDVGNDLAAIRLRVDLIGRTLALGILSEPVLEQARDDVAQIRDAVSHAASLLDLLEVSATDETEAEHA